MNIRRLPRQKYRSPRLICICDDTVQTNSFINCSVNFQGALRWNYRNPLKIKSITIETTSTGNDFQIWLYKNSTSYYNFEITNNTTNNITTKLPNGYKLLEGDLYAFTAICSNINESINLILEGEYEIIDDRVLYEGTMMISTNVVVTITTFDKWFNTSIGERLISAVKYEDTNSAFITGACITHDSATDIIGGLHIYKNGSAIISQGANLFNREQETYIPFGINSFWMNPNEQGTQVTEKVLFTIGLQDFNNAGADVSIRLIGYRRQLQGTRQYEHTFGARSRASSGIINGVYTTIPAFTNPQIYSNTYFSKPMRYFAGKINNVAGEVQGTIYKYNTDPYYENGLNIQDFDIDTKYQREVETDILFNNEDTDKYLRPDDYFILRMNFIPTGMTAGYRFICQNSITNPFLK